jgi:hypothetical protein
MKCRRGSPADLLRQLGYELVGLQVEPSAIADFGLDPSRSLSLEVAGRHGAFHVFRIIFRRGLDPEAIRLTASSLYRHNPTRRALLVFQARDDERLVLASWGLGPGPFQLQKLWIDPAAPRRSELDILAGLAVDGTQTPSELALAHNRALDREGITRKFFREFRRHRADLSTGLAGVPATESQDRLDLALTLLSRLLFLYFIQRKGWLNGDPAYLRNLLDFALDDGVPFYRRRLKPLFFGALNRTPDKRSRTALELGQLPYLNGGLFERTPLERKYARIDLPNDIFPAVFEGLLDKYQFTLRDDQLVDRDVAVDPEMLGKVFEGLMAASERAVGGAFFTPRSLVDRLVDGALSQHLARSANCEVAALKEMLAGHDPGLDPALRKRLDTSIRSLRVLDPAAGSGAFLLAALHRIESLRDVLEGRPSDSFERFQRRREIIRRNLYGVDVNAAAVRLCELRLWLALVVDLDVDRLDDVPPLPNLDINIRQGDALVDPLDFLLQLADLDHGSLASRWKKAVKRLSERRTRYFQANGISKRRTQRSLHLAERELAIEFLGELTVQIDSRRDDLRGAARGRDLFGRRSGLTRKQKSTATTLKRRKRQVAQLLDRVREHEELPFFSFPVHFADSENARVGFDVIVGNPPWVRTHHWSGLSRRRLRQRFSFLREAGWRGGSRMAGAGRGFGAQLDLSALFLERSLELLADDGALGFLLPAKLARSLSAGALRRRLLTGYQVTQIEDCSLATNRLFDATTYPMSLLLTPGKANSRHRVSIAVHDRRGERFEFRLPQERLSLLAGDPESPWALAPASVRAALDRMSHAGSPLGAIIGRRPRRGVFTGNNALFLGELADAVNHDGRAAVRLSNSLVDIESERLRPVLRGEDLGPWRFDLPRVLIWTHDDDGHPLPSLPRALHGHLEPHRRFLESRVDLKPGQPYWTLFRVDPAKSALRVAWRDIAPAPGATVVPARVKFLGSRAPIISLNTVYQIPVASGQGAHLLAGVLNSTVARAYLKAIAERASGGYFRFLGWTVALLPLPKKPDAAVRTEIVALSRRAHAARSITSEDRSRLDKLVAQLYRLTDNDLKALRLFDARLTNGDLVT